MLAGACGGTSVRQRAPASPSPTLAVTVEARSTVTPTATAEGPATVVSATEGCPDPNVTPVATSTPLTASAEPDTSATATPIRIAHPEDVPALPSPTPARTPVPTPPRPRIDAELERLVRDRLGADASHYAVVIEDLNDGRAITIDADRIFCAASLFKLEVMYEVFHQRDAGVLDFGEEYVASDYYAGFDLGPHRVQACARVSVGDLLSAMMSVSDNIAAVMLQDGAGAGNINAAMAALGLERTRLTEDGTLPATASDLALVIEAIARGEAVSRAASKAMANLMATEEFNDRIPAHLPAGTLVEHKTGNWDDATHDAGIVHGKKGTYVMVLLSDMGSDGDAAAVEADIAKIAFDYFEQ
jgi:beta-lactamase class A